MAAGVSQTCRLNWLVGPVSNPSVHWQCLDSGSCHKDRGDSAALLNFQPHCDMSCSPLIWFEAEHSLSTYIKYLENSSRVEGGLNLRDMCEGNCLCMLVEPAGAAILLNLSCQASNSMTGKKKLPTDSGASCTWHHWLSPFWPETPGLPNARTVNDILSLLGSGINYEHARSAQIHRWQVHRWITRNYIKPDIKLSWCAPSLYCIAEVGGWVLEGLFWILWVSSLTCST
jgi:hypothetical protein